MSHDRELGTFLTHHVAVPAAVIAMAASFLFFLVDLHSAFLGGGPSLKWIGFCFVVAAVLNERYGRSDEAHLKGFYTMALAGATIFVLLVAPWETPAGRFEARLANLLILAVVWYFATRVTRELSPETGRKAGPGLLIQLDLLLIDPWRSDDAEEPDSAPEPREAPPARPRNPAVMVARLAAAALLVFALGEPIVLEAAPQTGPKALAAVMAFLFSAGIVLAAGSALDAFRRAEAAGARVAPGLVPRRMGLAALLLGLVLAAALAMPGLSFQGTGRLRPPVTQGAGAEQDRGYQETESAVQSSPGDPGDVPGRRLQSDEGKPVWESSPWGTLGVDDPRQVSMAPDTPAPVDLSGWLAAWKWLLALPILLVALGLWKLVRRWPHLRRRRNPGGLLARRRRRDPLAGLDDLSERPSREAVLAAYHRFLMLLESLGHTRPAQATPYEVLHGLPPHLQTLEDPARTLTDLYVQAAYAAEPVERGDRERAVTALVEMRGLLERPAGPTAPTAA